MHIDGASLNAGEHNMLWVAHLLQRLVLLHLPNKLLGDVADIHGSPLGGATPFSDTPYPIPWPSIPAPGAMVTDCPRFLGVITCGAAARGICTFQGELFVQVSRCDRNVHQGNNEIKLILARLR